MYRVREEQRLVITTGYLDVGLHSQQQVIDRAKQQLADVDFDTFVATGLSGVSVANMLAHALDKHVFLVRKEDDKSNHSGDPAAGFLGKRWIFLDDFVDSGKTRERVKRVVTDLVAEYKQREYGAYVSEQVPDGGRFVKPAADFQPQYLGDYSYARGAYGVWHPGGETTSW